MKQVLFSLLIGAMHVQTFAQGTILFDTHVPGTVDTRWVFPGAPAEYYASLGVALALPPINDPHGLQMLLPTTTFKTTPASEVGYVEPVVVSVPGVMPGTKIDMFMKLFDLRSGVVLGITQSLISLGGGVTLGGNGLPPGYLTGFPSINGFFPEPSSATLLSIGISGAGLWCMRRSFFRHNNRVEQNRRPALRFRSRPGYVTTYGPCENTSPVAVAHPSRYTATKPWPPPDQFSSSSWRAFFC